MPLCTQAQQKSKLQQKRGRAEDGRETQGRGTAEIFGRCWGKSRHASLLDMGTKPPPPIHTTTRTEKCSPLTDPLVLTHATQTVNAPFFQRRSQSRTNRRRNRERERKGREEGRENKKEATKEAKTEENRRRCKKECDQAAHPELAVKTWELLRNLAKGASLELCHVRLSQGVKA